MGKEGMLVVLGGNQMACPAVLRLREHGYKVLVVDGNPDAPARHVADRFIQHNFSDAQSTSKVLSDETIAGIMPLNDFAVGAAALIARERGLPGWNEFAERCFRSKAAMKRAWSEAGLPTAAFCTFPLQALLAGDKPVWHIWPCVIKPSFSGGGSRGVFIASNWDEVFSGLLNVASKYLDGEVLFEEFIAGTEHTIEVVVCKGQPRLLSISDKENYPGSLTVVQNLYFPGPNGNAYREILEPLVYSACRVMQLTDGTTHFEVMLHDGKGYLLEVGGRPGGGINFHPICELSTGYDYPGILSAVLTGKKPDFVRKPSVHLAWHYFPAGSGVLESVIGFEKLQNDPMLVDAQLYEEIGKPRFDIRDDLARPGYVLVQATAHELAKKHAKALIESVTFKSVSAP